MMSENRKIIAFFAMLAFLPALTQGLCAENNAEKVKITGKVCDSGKRALEGVNVWVQTSYQGVVTGRDGEFAISVPYGKAEFRISFIGYQTLETEFFITADTVLYFELQPKAVLCDEVVVTSARGEKKEPLVFSDISKEKLQEKNIGAALPYVMETEPSMVSTSENGSFLGNTSFRLRGSDATRINVNINGIPLNDPESQYVYWVNIPNIASMAENVQVQRGVSATNGGTGAFGGAISLQTLNSSSVPYAQTDLSIGSFASRQISVAAGSGIMRNGFSLDAAYTKLNSDGFLRNGFCDHESFFLNAGKYGKNSLLKFIAIIGKQHTGITWNGASREEIAADPTYNNAGAYYDENGNIRYYDNETDNYWQQHYQLYYSLSLNRNWQFNAVADYTHGYGYYENYKADNYLSSYNLGEYVVVNAADTFSVADFVTQECERNNSYTGNVSVKYTGKSFSVTFGEMINYFANAHFGNVVWSEISSLLPYGDSEWYRNDARKTDASTYAKLEYSLSPEWLAYCDLQYRFVRYRIEGPDNDLLLLDYLAEYNFFNPKVGIAFSPARSQKFYFLAGIANREPTRGDIKDAIKTRTREEPSHETMLDLELGYSYNSNEWKLESNLYFMGYRNQLVSNGKINEYGYALMENVDKSYRLGIELNGGAKICRWLKFDANITLSTNRILDYVYWEEHYNSPDEWVATQQKAVNYGSTRIAFSPEIISAGVITFEPVQNLAVSFTGKYVGEQYIDNTERQMCRLDSYFVLNGKISYRLSVGHGYHAEFQFLVNNILDRQYINNGWTYEAHFDDGSADYLQQGFFVQPGINCMGRVVLKF